MAFQSGKRRHRSSRKRKKVEGWKQSRAENWNSLSLSDRRDIINDSRFVYTTEDGEHLNGEDALKLWRRSCLEKWPLHERKPILRSMNQNDRERILREMNLVQVWRYSDNGVFKVQAAIFSLIFLMIVVAIVFG